MWNRWVTFHLGQVLLYIFSLAHFLTFWIAACFFPFSFILKKRELFEFVMCRYTSLPLEYLCFFCVTLFATEHVLSESWHWSQWFTKKKGGGSPSNNTVKRILLLVHWDSCSVVSRPTCVYFSVVGLMIFFPLSLQFLVFTFILKHIRKNQVREFQSFITWMTGSSRLPWYSSVKSCLKVIAISRTRD